MTRRHAFVAGATAVAPVLVGIAPFGLVAGVTAVGVGLSVLEAAALSVVVFAGAAQLAMIDLVGRDAQLLVVVGTAIVINTRFLMYSASLAPYFLEEDARLRALVAYVLTDQAFALSVSQFTTAAEDVDEQWYYLGTALPLWAVWQVATVVGAVVGARVPAWLPLEFAVPMTFLALLIPSIRNLPTASAALVGGSVATVGASLPFNAGLLAGAFAGVGVGTVVAARTGTTVEGAE
jgi:4-azaleucine resistance transporter AzlC